MKVKGIDFKPEGGFSLIFQENQQEPENGRNPWDEVPQNVPKEK